MKLGPREIAVLALVLAIPVASYLLVFAPQNRDIVAAQLEISHKREMLTSLRNETARNDDLAQANTNIGNRIEEIEDRLPSTMELDNIIRQISDLAVTSGLSSPTLTSGKPIEAGTYWEQPLTVTTTGNFNGYYRFLQKLERMPRITRIPDFDLLRDPKIDGDVAIEFTLSIFFQDDNS
ncbi:MAG: type 4a pilus biogenesis protein PilO [Phycisphaerales bacterium JB054]